MTVNDLIEVCAAHDTCPHGQRMYEACDSCIEEFAVAAIAAPDTGGRDGDA